MAYNPKIHPFGQAHLYLRYRRRQDKHRRSIRLKGYDYTQPGAYFVTIDTYHRAEIFGEVVGSVMRLSPLGQIFHDEWLRSIGIRKEIQLFEDEFVVMPNHGHGIVWIVETPIVGVDGVRPGIEGTRPEDQGARRAPQTKPQQKLYRVPKSLGSFIAGFKSAVSSRAKRELNMTGIWQRNYYEHIIRSETAFKNIWNYIDNNPRKWEEDKLHLKAPPNKFNQDHP